MSPQATAPVWARTKDGLAFADVATVAGGRMPDFCIVGAAKCGTTALNAMLAAQPFIFMNPLKEPHYFSTKVILDKGDDWYRGLYARATPDQFLGEASTSYTRYPLCDETIGRLIAANPGMKLIYMLREPVSRTESECLQLLKFTRHALGEDHTHLPLDDFFRMVEDPGHP